MPQNRSSEQRRPGVPTSWKVAVVLTSCKLLVFALHVVTAMFDIFHHALPSKFLVCSQLALPISTCEEGKFRGNTEKHLLYSLHSLKISQGCCTRAWPTSMLAYAHWHASLA